MHNASFSSTPDFQLAGFRLVVSAVEKGEDVGAVLMGMFEPSAEHAAAARVAGGLAGLLTCFAIARVAGHKPSHADPELQGFLRGSDASIARGLDGGLSGDQTEKTARRLQAMCSFVAVLKGRVDAAALEVFAEAKFRAGQGFPMKRTIH